MLRYYKESIRFYGTIYYRPIFWLLSDEPKWIGHKELKYNSSSTLIRSSSSINDPVSVTIPPEDVRMPRINDNVLKTFHRMVQADGLVLSRSSLSAAAALLSKAPILVTTAYSNPREHW